MLKKILLLIITGMGIAILFLACSILKQSRDALNWPQTKGDVISSFLIINHLPKFLDRNVDPSRWYGTEVQYGYSVHGERYVSNRLSFYNGFTRNPKEALKVMNKYRRHHQIIVYYDPQDTKEAVLEPGAGLGDIYIPLILGGFLIFFGFFAFYRQSLDFNHGIDSYIHQGQIYQDRLMWEEAFRQYNQAISINPNYAPAYSSRGSLYLERKNWDQAIADLNRAISIAPHNALTYFTLAKAYQGNKQYDKALVNMHKAIEKGFNVKPEILEDLKRKLS